MKVELNYGDIAVLLESLQYSKRNVADARETSATVRKENLQRLEAVEEKLRAAKKAQGQ